MTTANLKTLGKYYLVHMHLSVTNNNKSYYNTFRRGRRNSISTSRREFHRDSGHNLQRIMIRDILQIHDDVPRTIWSIVNLEDLVRDGDGLMRLGIAHTTFGLTNRPIAKLYPLEMNSNDSGECQIFRKSIRLQNRNQRL